MVVHELDAVGARALGPYTGWSLLLLQQIPYKVGAHC